MSESESVRALERFTEEMSKIDAVAHVLLKGHLILEEQLVSIIEQYVFHRDYLQEARLSFAQKLAVARSFCLSPKFRPPNERLRKSFATVDRLQCT